MEGFRGEKRREKSSLDTINEKNDKKMEDETKCRKIKQSFIFSTLVTIRMEQMPVESVFGDR